MKAQVNVRWLLCFETKATISVLHHLYINLFLNHFFLFFFFFTPCHLNFHHFCDFPFDFFPPWFILYDTFWILASWFIKFWCFLLCTVMTTLFGYTSKETLFFFLLAQWGNEGYFLLSFFVKKDGHTSFQILIVLSSKRLTMR